MQVARICVNLCVNVFYVSEIAIQYHTHANWHNDVTCVLEQEFCRVVLVCHLSGDRKHDDILCVVWTWQR